MKNLIILFTILFLLGSCAALIKHDRMHAVERCIHRMLEEEVPADIAQDICSKTYKTNIHETYRKLKTEASQTD